MARIDDRRFSLGWVFVSYFMICGGIVAAVIAVVATIRDTQLAPRVAGYVACGAGGAVGGLFAGRASRHFSVLEPALAGAGVIASLFALIKYTAIGPLVFTFARDAIVRESLVLGGLAFGGGMVGAVVGELSAPRQPSVSPLRWLGMSVFLTAGALLVTTIATQLLLVDRKLRDPELVAKLWRNTVPFSEDEVATAVLIALAGAGFLGGLVTQWAAPVRMLVASSVGVLVAIAGALIGVLELTGNLQQDTVAGAVALGGGAAVLGFVGAVIAYLLRRILATLGLPT